MILRCAEKGIPNDKSLGVHYLRSKAFVPFNA